MSCKADGPRVRFPFRIIGKHARDCGYEGFEIYCSSTNDSILHLPDGSANLSVTRIDYRLQQLYVRDEPASNNVDQRYKVIALRNDVNPCYLAGVASCPKLYEAALTFDPQYFNYFEPDVILSWSTPDCTSCEEKLEGTCIPKKNNSYETQVDCLSQTDPNNKGTTMSSASMVVEADHGIKYSNEGEGEGEGEVGISNRWKCKTPKDCKTKKLCPPKSPVIACNDGFCICGIGM
ncbi:hypothetical protein ACFE04_010099 [Oxalis oulophora]